MLVAESVPVMDGEDAAARCPGGAARVAWLTRRSPRTRQCSIRRFAHLLPSAQPWSRHGRGLEGSEHDSRAAMLRDILGKLSCAVSSDAASRASGGIGRRAGFRCQCPKGRGGSTPPSRTTRKPALTREHLVEPVSLLCWCAAACALALRSSTHEAREPLDRFPLHRRRYVAVDVHRRADVGMA